jgi:hypothetical protein
VPQLNPETDEEKRRHDDAGRRRELRTSELERRRATRPPEIAIAGTVRPGRK